MILSFQISNLDYNIKTNDDCLRSLLIKPMKQEVAEITDKSKKPNAIIYEVPHIRKIKDQYPTIISPSSSIHITKFPNDDSMIPRCSHDISPSNLYKFGSSARCREFKARSLHRKFYEYVNQNISSQSLRRMLCKCKFESICSFCEPLFNSKNEFPSIKHAIEQLISIEHNYSLPAMRLSGKSRIILIIYMIYNILYYMYKYI